jgi:PHD/YefM family antitoxin component YafN of YafNO toxin-antitoxin module
MKEISAAELRQGLSKVARGLERSGEPILLKLGQRPVGVIVSLKDFQERFALKKAGDLRRQLVEEIVADRRPADKAIDAVIAELRKP